MNIPNLHSCSRKSFQLKGYGQARAGLAIPTGLPKDKFRSRQGYGIIELAAGSLFLVVMAILSLDLVVLMIADSILDRATRDATRSAAGRSSASSAQSAAKTALLSHKTDGYIVSQPKLAGTSAPYFVYQDYGGDPFTGNPYVTVTAKCTVRLPAPIICCGAVFNTTGSGGPGTIDFSKSYTFPIVNFNLTNSSTWPKP
jgi:Flp pilus assembly protein TadG